MSWNTCKYDLCESYTARPDGDYCETHRRAIGKMKVDEIKAAEKRKKLLSKPKNIYKPPNKVSAKQKTLNETYSQMREDFLRMTKECEVKVNKFCTNKPETIHHKRGRGKYFLAPETWLPCCMSCHQYIEQHPKEAKEKGWSESRLATEPHKI